MFKKNNQNRNAIMLMALFFMGFSVKAQDLTQNQNKIFEFESTKKSQDYENLIEKKAKEELIVDLKEGQVPPSDEDILFKQEGNKEPIVPTETFSFAVNTKNYDKIENFLHNGTGVNQIISEGNTLVNFSALYKDVNMLKIAANNKANLSNLNSNKESVIYWGASGKGVEYLQQVKTLMVPKEFETLMPKTSKLGRTALHNAILYKADPEVVSFLVENKIPMDVKDNNGQTALHYAAVMRKWEALAILVKHGGSLKEVDKNEQSVESYIMDKLEYTVMATFYPYLNEQNKKIIESRLGSMGTSFSDELKPGYVKKKQDQSTYINLSEKQKK